MQNDIVNVINNFNKTAYETTKQLADINARVFGKLVDQQLTLAGRSVDYGVKQTEIAREAKDFADFADRQTNLVKDYSEQNMATVRETLNIVSEARDELSTWLDKGVSEAASTAEAAAATATDAGKKAASKAK